VSRDAVLLFLASLALLGQVGLAVGLIAFVGGHRTARLRWWIVDSFGASAVTIALVVSIVAVGGSLYLSEVAHFIPCKLCWYQRIAMYPLPVLLASAAIRRRRDAHFYVIPVAALGSIISSYHILVERFPRLESSVCDASNPCTVIWTRRFGYQTIPTMALTAFVLIIAALSIGVVSDRQPTDSNREQ
jgi:energy-converting hydrogenase Eha subunit A